jgi:hypothetical protein
MVFLIYSQYLYIKKYKKKNKGLMNIHQTLISKLVFAHEKPKQCTLPSLLALQFK